VYTLRAPARTAFPQAHVAVQAILSLPAFPTSPLTFSTPLFCTFALRLYGLCSAPHLEVSSALMKRKISVPAPLLAKRKT